MSSEGKDEKKFQAGDTNDRSEVPELGRHFTYSGSRKKARVDEVW